MGEGAPMAGSTQSVDHHNSDQPAFSIGRWIWTNIQRPNHYVAFVKTVPLQRRQEVVRVRIIASSYYELFLNGEYVARGPVYGDPHWCLYDELSFTPAADAKQLNITILVHHSDGANILSLLPAPGGVIADFYGDDWHIGT